MLSPVRTDVTTDYYRISMAAGASPSPPRLPDPVWGYNGSVPGPTFRATQGRVVVRHINNLPPKHPDPRLHARGPRCTCTAQASLPQYDGYASDISNPGQWKDYRYPNWQPHARSGTTTTACTTRPRTSTWAWPACTSCVDALEQALPIPTASSTCR